MLDIFLTVLLVIFGIEFIIMAAAIIYVVFGEAIRERKKERKKNNDGR